MQSEETLAAYLDGSLPAEDRAALEEAALNEGELLREIVHQRKMEAALRGLLGETQRMEEAIMVSVRGVSDETAAARVMTVAMRGPTARPARAWRLPSPFSPALLAALVMIGCIITAAWWWSGSEPATLATIREVHDARWTRGIPLQRGARLGTQPVTLDAGSIELELQSGAILTLEGPVTFALRAGNHLALTSGKVAAFAPATAKGLTISTPTSRVVDLGTRFGVWTDGQNSEAHVFEGSVDVAATNTAPLVRLQAGSATRIEGGRLQPIRLNEEAFPATLRRIEGLQRDGSFEKTTSLRAAAAPPGEWSASGCAIVQGSARGVRPNHGRSMLQFLSGASSLSPADSEEPATARQMVDLKQWRAEIAGGQVEVIVSVRFNQGGEQSAVMGISVAALRAEEAGQPIPWNTLPLERRASADGECDTDPRTWEMRRVRLKLPPDTVAIMAQLQARKIPGVSAEKAPSGHFADNAAITLLLPHSRTR